MTTVLVKQLCGLGGVPTCRRNAGNWLRARGVEFVAVPTKGGPADAVRLGDLPEDVRREFTLKALASLELDPGTYDKDAHWRLISAPPGMRDEAERKAGIARVIRAGRKAGFTRAAVHQAVWDAYGTVVNTAKTLDRLEAQIREVYPVNFASALLAEYKGGAPYAEMHPNAWELFETGLKGAFKTHSMAKLHEDVERIATENGWEWPSYSTVMRRFGALPAIEPFALKEGREAAYRRFYQSNLRDSTKLSAMEWVSMDGRTVDL